MDEKGAPPAKQIHGGRGRMLERKSRENMNFIKTDFTYIDIEESP